MEPVLPGGEAVVHYSGFVEGAFHGELEWKMYDGKWEMVVSPELFIFR